MSNQGMHIHVGLLAEILFNREHGVNIMFLLLFQIKHLQQYFAYKCIIESVLVSISIRVSYVLSYYKLLVIYTRAKRTNGFCQVHYAATCTNAPCPYMDNITYLQHGISEISFQVKTHPPFPEKFHLEAKDSACQQHLVYKQK